MTTLAFFLRVLLETELNWYYVWPVAALCLLLSARRGAGRFCGCSAALAASLVLGNHNAIHHVTLWWPALMATLAAMLACAALPRRRLGAPADAPPDAAGPARPVECGTMAMPVRAGQRSE